MYSRFFQEPQTTKPKGTGQKIPGWLIRRIKEQEEKQRREYDRIAFGFGPQIKKGNRT